MDTHPVRTADISEREWALLEHKAHALVGSKLIPAGLTEQDLFIMGLAARAVGMDLTPLTVKEFPIIEGSITPSAQISVAIAAAHGHTMWPEEYGPERCTYAGHRHGMDDRVIRVTWTIDMARQAGKLDEWVEDWKTASSGKRYAVKVVIRRLPDGSIADTDANGVKLADWAWQEIQAGKIKRAENWHRYPADMLAARAAKRLARMIAGDALLGMAAAPLWADDDEPAVDTAPARIRHIDAETGEVTDIPYRSDDDPVDAELVDDQPPPDREEEQKQGEVTSDGPVAPIPTPNTAPGPDGPLVDDKWTQRFAITVREQGWTDQQRHELIHHATRGRVRSSKEVRVSEVPAVRDTYRQILDGQLAWKNLDGTHVLLPGRSDDDDMEAPF